VTKVRKEILEQLESKVYREKKETTELLVLLEKKVTREIPENKVSKV
tara:strand:- start:213 stop:353 length:141 start_codon:yes stop_codon:yes gene_type:complete